MLRFALGLSVVSQLTLISSYSSLVLSPTDELCKLRSKARRSNKLAQNLEAVESIVEKYNTHFAPLLELCPGLTIILAHMLILRFGFSVQDVSWTSELVDWTGEDNRRVGRSMAYFVRMVQTGDAAVGLW